MLHIKRHNNYTKFIRLMTTLDNVRKVVSAICRRHLLYTSDQRAYENVLREKGYTETQISWRMFQIFG